MNRKNARLLIIAAIIAIIVVLAIVLDLDIASLFSELLDWIEDQGALGPIIFIGVYILAAVFLIPASILTLGGGAVFGLVEGAIYVSIGSTLGATLAFLAGRYLLRGWVEKKIANSPKFVAVDQAIGSEGGKIIFLLRLSPLFPYNISNYLYSLTKVKLLTYVLASWAGFIPGTVMYVYFGSLIQTVSEAGDDFGGRSTLEYVLYGVGLIATIVAALYVARIARRAIAKHIADDGGNAGVSENKS